MNGTPVRPTPVMLLLVVILFCTSCHSDVFSEPEPWQIDEETSCLPWEAEHEGSCINIPPQGKYKLILDHVESNCSAIPDEWRDILFTLNSTTNVSFYFSKSNTQQIEHLLVSVPVPMPRLFPSWIRLTGEDKVEVKNKEITFKKTKTTDAYTINTALKHNTTNRQTSAQVEVTLSTDFNEKEFPFGPTAPCKETYNYSMELLEECPFHCTSRATPPKDYEKYPEMAGYEFYPNGPTQNLYWPELVHTCFCVER